MWKIWQYVALAVVIVLVLFGVALPLFSAWGNSADAGTTLLNTWAPWTTKPATERPSTRVGAWTDAEKAMFSDKAEPLTVEKCSAAANADPAVQLSNLQAADAKLRDGLMSRYSYADTRRLLTLLEQAEPPATGTGTEPTPQEQLEVWTFIGVLNLLMQETCGSTE